MFCSRSHDKTLLWTTHVTEVIERVCSCDWIANQRVRSRTGSGVVGQFVVNLVNRVEIGQAELGWLSAKSMVISGKSTINDEHKKPTLFIPKISISSQLLYQLINHVLDYSHRSCCCCCPSSRCLVYSPEHRSCLWDLLHRRPQCTRVLPLWFPWLPLPQLPVPLNDTCVPLRPFSWATGFLWLMSEEAYSSVKQTLSMAAPDISSSSIFVAICAFATFVYLIPPPLWHHHDG